MKDELADRQRAIQLRLTGESIPSICRVLRRSRDWFHRWWRHYRAKGPDGLFELTHINHHPRRLAPEVEPWLIPPAKPERNGSVENFTGWLQVRLFQRHFSRVSALRLELQLLQDAVNTQHTRSDPRRGGLTPAQYRRQKQLSKLPPRYVVPTELTRLAAGRVTFIRQVSRLGKIHLLSLTYHIGKRLKGQYVKAVLDTQRHRLTVYLNGRVLKRWPYPCLKS